MILSNMVRARWGCRPSQCGESGLASYHITHMLAVEGQKRRPEREDREVYRIEGMNDDDEAAAGDDPRLLHLRHIVRSE